MEEHLTLIALLAPLSLLGYALTAISEWGKNQRQFNLLPQYLSGLAIFTSLISALIVANYGALQSGLLGWEGLGFSLRLDSLSIAMLTMIAILGLVVLRFSKNYLDGDARKNVFMARLAATIASVEFLVLSGNLGQLLFFWVITSVCLHYLLVFYRSRPQAIAAARKKFIVARVGDLSLLAAVVLIYQALGTGDLDKIFSAVQQAEVLDTSLMWATILLVFTAVLKSAQFPTHGWLIEVVETPTPVSALLHAGLLNAGPFLMVRMGFLMTESTPASLMLIIIGGFTALFASVVYLTQPTIKVGLGYSSVAHMGFSLLVCGFGVYTAAILHVIAHSFYKAHAFLSSGSVIDAVRARKVTLPARKGSPLRIGLSIAFALGIYVLFCNIWGVQLNEDFTLMATGAIIVMGLSQVIASALDSRGTLQTVLQTGAIAFVVAASFFYLENGARVLFQSQLPAHYQPNPTIFTAAALVIALFSLVVVIQLLAPVWPRNELTYRLGIHLRNGLYANVLFDRMIGSLKNEKFKWANLTVQEELESEIQELTRYPSVSQTSKSIVKQS